MRVLLVLFITETFFTSRLNMDEVHGWADAFLMWGF
jgi:hypothetical protein